jgi:hypothetical protein
VRTPTDAPLDASAFAPANVLIIRHAEKPLTGPGLSEEGQERAAALPQLFVKSDARPDPFPTPGFLIAAQTSPESSRPVDTVSPLGARLGLHVKDDVKDKHYAQLVGELKDQRYAGKTVLICWHHGEMPALAEALGGTGIPDKIDEGTYDLIWRIDYADGEAKTTLGTQNLILKE